MKTNAATREKLVAHKITALRRRLLPVLIAGCFGTAVANPLGPQVVNGQVSFNNQGNVLSVTNTPGAIINWQSFSINPGELTRFIQQNPTSAVLNRIIGQDPSQILGALQSNGRVFLINPNGILFGQGAQVDVNGLVASTLNISNEDFLSGKMNFKAGDKAGNLKNQGAITTPGGGQVYLVAPNVENSGIITSPQGEVLLAAGHSVQLVDSMNPDLHVVVSAPENEALNLGQVIAQGGKTGIYGALVKQRGIVSANSAVVGESGKVVLKASRDTILEVGSKTTATGEGKGGEIHVLGERVGLVGDAKIDASGKTGGGTVLVGGDYQGKNAAIQNAERTYVGKDAAIRSDAIDSGDGGKVIVWADDITRAYGSISAKGGAKGGNGGLVETSGKVGLDIAGIRVDASASNGSNGAWLLDPSDVTIVHGSAGALTAGMFDPGGPSSIGDTEINAALNSTNVTIQTSTGTSGTGNIVINGTADGGGAVQIVNASGGTRSLTMNANNHIQMHGGASIAGSIGNPLDVNLMALGQVSMATNASIATQGGNVVLSGTGNAGGTAGVLLSGASIDAGAGLLSITGIGYSGGGVGVNLQQSSILANGGISIIGTGHGTTTWQHGILVQGKGAAGYSLKSAYDTYLMGSTDATGSVQVGVLVTDGGHVEATGTGNIAINGTGGPGTGNNHGVLINGSPTSKVLAENGNITLIGTAGDTTSSSMGVGIGGFDSYVEATGSGSVNITAITPSGGQGSDFNLYSTSPNGIRTNGGSIFIKADNMMLSSGKINAGTGSVTLTPYSLGALVDIGGAASDAVNKLGLSSTELAAIATSGKLTIGDPWTSARTGSMTVGSLDLSTSLGGGLVLNAAQGNLLLGGTITVPSDLEFFTNAGTLTNNAAITAGGAVSIFASSGTFTNNSTISAGANVNLRANKMVLASAAGRSITADGGSGWVAISTDGNVDLGSSTDSAPGTLELSNAELNTIYASGIGINAGNLESDKTITVSAPIAPAHFSGLGLFANGDVTVNSGVGITMSGEYNHLNISGIADIEAFVNSYSGAAKITNGGTLRASSVMLDADKMALAGGTIDTGSSGFVALRSNNQIDLGTLNTADATVNVLELNNAELNSITTHFLSVQTPEAITIKTAIAPSLVHALSLKAQGAVAQDSGATIGGSIQNLEAVGSAVTLPEANGVGVIAGMATAGDFVFRSVNQVHVGLVGSTGGIDAGSGKIKLKSDSAGISQSHPFDYACSGEVCTYDNSIRTTGGLVLEAAGMAALGNPTNDITKLAAKLNTGLATVTTGSGIVSTNGMVVDSLPGVDGIDINGIVTNNSGIKLGVNTSAEHLTVNQPINAGTGWAVLEADRLVLNNNVTASNVGIHPYSPGRTITVGAADCNGVSGDTSCLLVNDLHKIAAPVIAIGTKDTTKLPGNIYVGGITAGGATLTDRHADTTRILLATGGSVSQPTSGPGINVQELGVRTIGAGTVALNNTANAVTKLSGMTDGGAYSFKNSQNLTIASISGSIGTTAYSQTGINAGSTGDVALEANGSISGGPIAGATLTATAVSGMTLTTKVGTLSATNSGANNITITNAIPMTLGTVTQSLAGGSGAITVHNTGALTVAGPVSTSATGPGAITLTAASPLSVTGNITAGTGPITLTAGASGSSGDTLTITGTVSSAGPITLNAGDAIVGAANATTTLSGGKQVNQFQNPSSTPSTPPPAPPTVDQCAATPTMAGCSAVLPTVDACTVTPALTGCTAVLPTVGACTATPTLPGCSAVLPPAPPPLPPLSVCVAAPSTPGCSTVLPTVGLCTATPTLPGCSVVLPPPPPPPSLNVCVAAPSTAGCSAVLPPIGSCTANPTLAGCSVVLPTLSLCAATPTLEGCSVVVPITVLPGTPTQTRDAVSDKVNSTVNTIVLATTAPQVATDAASPARQAAGGASGSQPNKPAEKSDSTDEKKDDKKTTAGPDDSGAKKNESTKKMYCN
jgi:filamentous hemagglutinin family protein